MSKIMMTTPLVEMDGDEMTRIVWKIIKEELICPFVDLKTEYYDLGLEYREATKDQVTTDASNAIKKYGVGVKCATITPNAARVKEYNLTQMWKSPNGTIRAILDGTVFRTPIIVNCVKSYVPTWTEPITIARHAYGDIYRNVEMKVPAGKAELVFTDTEGNVTRKTIHEFKEPGIIQGVHNLNKSIESYAHSCFKYALDLKQDLYDTVYAPKFAEAGISYKYTLIDAAVAGAMRSKGGYFWACKNYDGDVMSDMIAAAYGSIAMMTSVLVSPEGNYEFEAAHGTVQDQYYMHLKGEETSTNSVATIFAWSGALRKRGEMDGLKDLCAFADKLEQACFDTIESGHMTGDLAALTTLDNVVKEDTFSFIQAIKATLTKLMED